MICRECRTLPRADLQRILATGEIHGFLDQKNISQKNIGRLKDFASIDDETFQELRGLILEIAMAAPRKRRRWKLLSANRKDLIQKAVDIGLIEDVREADEFQEPEMFDFTQVPDWDESDFDEMYGSTTDPECTNSESSKNDIPF